MLLLTINVAKVVTMTIIMVIKIERNTNLDIGINTLNVRNYFMNAQYNYSTKHIAKASKANILNIRKLDD